MKKDKNSGIKAEDQELWRKVARTVRAYVSPAAPPEPPAGKPRAADAGIRAPAKAPAVKQPAVKAAAVPAVKAQGFDRSTATKLRKGQLAIEGSLDLHGMTQAKAFEALCRFIRSAVAMEKRTILVITGKGARSEGVLKKMLPLWLEDSSLSRHIIAVTPAQPKDGGSGAFYLRLKRQKA